MSKVVENMKWTIEDERCNSFSKTADGCWEINRWQQNYVFDSYEEAEEALHWMIKNNVGCGPKWIERL